MINIFTETFQERREKILMRKSLEVKVLRTTEKKLKKKNLHPKSVKILKKKLLHPKLKNFYIQNQKTFASKTNKKLEKMFCKNFCIRK